MSFSFSFFLLIILSKVFVTLTTSIAVFLCRDDIIGLWQTITLLRKPMLSKYHPVLIIPRAQLGYHPLPVAVERGLLFHRQTTLEPDLELKF